MEESLNEFDGPAPQWPVCCALSSNSSIIKQTVKLENPNLNKVCTAPIDPSVKKNPQKSLYDLDGCLCIKYSSSSTKNEVFSEKVLEKMQEEKTTGIQQLVATFDGVTGKFQVQAILWNEFLMKPMKSPVSGIKR